MTMTGDQLRAAAEDAYNRSAWRAAQRLTDQAVEAWGQMTDDQLDWWADMLERLEVADPVLT